MISKMLPSNLSTADPETLAAYLAMRQADKEALLETTVRLVAVPLPPTPVQGLLYMPSCYASETYDNIFKRDWSEGAYNCIAVVDTTQGPAFYMRAKLGTLLSLRFNATLNRYKVAVKSSAFCASIEYDHAKTTVSKQESKGLVTNYADDVRLLSMSLIGRSCHGGSHLVVPDAPFLTALLQYQSAPDNTMMYTEDGERRVAGRYVRPDEAKPLFETALWHKNKAIDMFISDCYVGEHYSDLKKIDSQFHFFHSKESIGDWAAPLHRQLTYNILTPLGDYHGLNEIHSGSGGNPQEVAADDCTLEGRDSFSGDLPSVAS